MGPRCALYHESDHPVWCVNIDEWGRRLFAIGLVVVRQEYVDWDSLQMSHRHGPKEHNRQFLGSLQKIEADYRAPNQSLRNCCFLQSTGMHTSVLKDIILVLKRYSFGQPLLLR